MIRVDSGHFFQGRGRDTCALVESPFYTLPNEMILEIFKNFTPEELHPLHLTCQKFRNLAWDPILYKEESHAMKTMIRRFIDRLPELEKNEILERMEAIHEEGHVILKLNHLAGKCLKKLYLSELAVLDLDDPIFENAPLFRRSLENKFPQALREAIVRQLSSHLEALTINFTLLEKNSPVFFHTLQEIGFSQDLILSDIGKDDLLLIAQAVEVGTITPAAVSVYECPNLQMLEIFRSFMTSIGKSASVKRIHFRNLNLYRENIEVLRESFRENQTLKSLSLTDITLNEGNVELLIAFLEEHPHITDISLERICKEELEKLVPQLNRTHLKSIVITKAYFCETMLEYLAEQIPRFTKLEELHLEQSRVNNQGIKHLKNALASEAMTEKSFLIHLPLSEALTTR